jgi:hypothetical protein
VRAARVAASFIAAIACAAGAAVPARAAASTSTLPPIRHVFVIVLENKGFADDFVLGQAAAPYLTQTLPSMGVLIPRYYGTGHASADNYIAMVSGQPPTPASKNDCPDPLQPVAPDSVSPYGLAKSDGCLYPPNFETVADQLTERGLTWKGYMEDIPALCSPLKSNPAAGTHYARKHNPFVFFRSLIDSGQCAADDVGLGQLSGDLASASRTPNLVYITPNECNDGHTNCTQPAGSNPVTDTFFELQQADAFLKQWVPKILASPAYEQDGLLLVTFDEADADVTACCNEQPGPADPNPGGEFGSPGPGGGQTGAIAISPFIAPGTTSTGEYNHYSLLRSMEDLICAPHLGFAGQQGLVPFGSDVYDGSFSPAGCPGPAGGAGGAGQPGPPGSGGQTGCSTHARPVSVIARRTRRPGRQGLHLSGRASEHDCKGHSTPVRVVRVSIARTVGRGSCRFLTIGGRALPSRRCSRPFYLVARVTGSRWRLAVRGPIAPARYVARARATDVDGAAGRAAVLRLAVRR